MKSLLLCLDRKFVCWRSESALRHFLLTGAFELESNKGISSIPSDLLLAFFVSVFSYTNKTLPSLIECNFYFFIRSIAVKSKLQKQIYLEVRG